jgi:hypothetical protein
LLDFSSLISEAVESFYSQEIRQSGSAALGFPSLLDSQQNEEKMKCDDEALMEESYGRLFLKNRSKKFAVLAFAER